MPRMTERERLVDLESRRRRLDDEVETVRRTLRARYAAMVGDIAVETLSEKDFRDILTHLVRAGGSAAVAALKVLPAART